MLNTKRLFLAIKINPEEQLIEVLNQLKNKLKNEKVRWANPDHLHLTLKFFGAVSVIDIEIIIPAIERAVQAQRRFELNIENLSIFGSSYNPNVIWAGISKSIELVNLEQNIISELEKIGFKNDRQNFVPHLTLGRIKKLQDKKYFNQIISEYKTGHFQVSLIDKIILYESVLKPTGAVHSEIHEFPFKA